jgi:hypothetical protein
MSRAQDLFAVLRARIDAHATMHAARAPVRAVVLRAPELAHVGGRALDLFVSEPRADVALPRLVAELAADLGEANVGVLELADTWVPEARARLVPYRAAPAKREDVARFVSSAAEPSRFLGEVIAPPSRPLGATKLLARLESVEWWRRGVHVRDLVSAELATEGVGRGVAWLEIERRGGETSVKLRGWMD